jgi:hypothetical protein
MRPENYAGVDKCMYSTELEWYESFHIEKEVPAQTNYVVPVVTQIHWGF